MAYPQPKYAVATRDPLLDFIIWEEVTPNGHSRKALKAANGDAIQVAADVKIGDAVTATGTKAKADGTDFAGISLVQLSSTLGVHTNGDIGASILFRDAEVKDLGWSADIKAKMVAAGIDVLVTGK